MSQVGDDETGPPSFSLSDGATLAVAFFAVGMTVAVTLVERGTDPSVIILGGMICYAVTSQLAFIAVSDAGGSLLAAVLSGWLVTTRFGILAVALRGLFPVRTMERVALALVAVDPNVGLTLQQADLSSRRRVYWGVTAALTIGWMSGTLTGVVVGNVIGDINRWGLDVMFPAALLAIIGNRYHERDSRWAAVLGAAIFLAFLWWAPAGVPILASALGAVAVAWWRARSGPSVVAEVDR
jgi:predicted branched-subunit amino acid permease